MTIELLRRLEAHPNIYLALKVEECEVKVGGGLMPNRIVDKNWKIRPEWLQFIGITARQIQRIVKRVANRAGIAKTVTPHVLRHTFSVTCLKRGISIRTLQYFLGHGWITTTEIYMNLSPEDAIWEFQSKR